MPVDGGDIVTFDSRVSPEWNRDGRHVYTLVGDAGASEVFRIGAVSGGPEQMTKGRCRNVMGFSVACDGSVAFTATGPACPGELFYLGLSGETQQLTSVNAEYFKDTGVYPPRRSHTHP
jgi:dipeptidyl aminopeptidase/acylaminoacyl peptidase